MNAKVIQQFVYNKSKQTHCMQLFIIYSVCSFDNREIEHEIGNHNERLLKCKILPSFLGV